ncbi:MAG: GNAT family N-acetyltransferase [Ilumatobacteraceae bacterium]
MRQVSVAPEPLRVGEYVLRKYETSDAHALVDSVTASHEHLEPWMPWMKFEPQTVAQREELIRTWSEAWDNRTEFVMGIFLGDHVVGGTGFHLRGDVNTVEIGYWVHVDYIGRGIATQVSRALCEAAFAMWPEIDIVEIVHDEANVASGKVPDRLGFQHVFTGQRQPEAPGESGVLYRWEKKRAT